MSEYIVRETGYPGTIKQEIVQELVRCKDCRYYYRHEFFGKPYFTCDIANQYMTGDIIGVGFEPPEDWYCADGERRDDE